MYCLLFKHNHGSFSSRSDTTFYWVLAYQTVW